MLRVVVATALAGIALQSASAGELDFSFGAEAGAEYASGLRYDHDLNFDTPPKRIQDFRYTYELSAAASFTMENWRVRSSYTFDQRTYEDFDLFHRRRHDLIAEVITDALWGVDLGARFRYRVSQPEGAAGYIDSEQLRFRAVFPQFTYAPLAINVQPSAYMLWQTTDFHKLRFLDSDTWETGFGTTIAPEANNWTLDVSVAYGLIDARWNLASNSYVDLSLDLASETARFFKDAWTGPIALELGLDYREEWYEGLGSDLGTQRHDRVAGVELTARRELTNRFSTFARTSFDDHESNWGNENFDELTTAIGLSFQY
jgi:hypothetical protein